MSVPAINQRFAPSSSVAPAKPPASWRIARDRLWAVASFPYWLGSGLPAPIRSNLSPPAAPQSEAAEHLIVSLRKISQRLWLQRAITTLARAAWLPGLLICLIAPITGFGFARTLPEDALWLWLASITIGLVIILTSRPSIAETASLLDHSFALQDRLRTALHHTGQAGPLPGSAVPISYLQVADAANAASALTRHPALRLALPIREAAIALAVALVITALFFIDGHRMTLPSVTTSAIPGFVSAADRIPETSGRGDGASISEDQPTLEEVEAMAARSAAARSDLLLLADALADHAVTSDVADHIRRGDYASAATKLREVARSADQLSPAARNELADDLDAAAAEMSDEPPGLNQATEQAAAGLRAGGEAARSGMTELADAIDATGSQVVPQSELARQRSQAQESQRSSQADRSPTPDPGAATAHSNENGETGSDGTPQAGSNGDPQGSGQTPSSGSGADQSDGAQTPTSGENGQAAPTPGGEPDANRTPERGEQPNGEEGDPQSGQPNGDPEASANDDQSGSSGEPGPSGTGEDTETGTGVGQPTPASNAETTPVPGTTPTTGESSISLSGSGEETIELGGGEETAAGAGGGSTSGEGDVAQGVVDDAGPDSNRVPPEYRDVVERYFDREED